MAGGNPSPALAERLTAAVNVGTGEAPVKAVDFIRIFKTDSKPAQLHCDDGHDYIVKDRLVNAHSPRVVVTEHIVGRLGALLGAPTGTIAYVDVPADLINSQSELTHFTPGPTHGSRCVPNCTEREALVYTGEASNRLRFALLALLYTWVGADDHQFIYTKDTNTVYSVDHGHFFPGAPNWTASSLQLAASTAITSLDPFFDACALTPPELDRARQALDTITVEQIEMAVASPPEGWGFTIPDRIVVVDYLIKRRTEVLIVADKRIQGVI